MHDGANRVPFTREADIGRRRRCVALTGWHLLLALGLVHSGKRANRSLPESKVCHAIDTARIGLNLPNSRAGALSSGGDLR